MVFPVSGINRLGECFHLDENIGLPHSGYLVLDSGQESSVVLMTESRVVPFQLR